MNKRISIILGVILGTTIMCANAETVRYWSDGVLYETTSCSDGGDVTLPTAPTPPEAGYVFTGWSVDTYDFSTLNASTNGDLRWSKNLDGICQNNDGNNTECSSNYAGLNNGNWRVQFSYGDVYGDALCSETSGTANVVGTPNESRTGSYCWCRVRGYKPTETAGLHTKTYIPTTTPSWLLFNDRGSASVCISNCATDCGGRVRGNATMRTAMFQ